MKKYALQWKDPEGFCHFVSGNLHGAFGGVMFHDSWEEADVSLKNAKKSIEEYLKGTTVIKKRLFGPPTIVSVNKPSGHLANMHKRMYDTMHIAEINIMPKQMR
ncbi:hypothetical protein PHG31p22 [Aeromonas phage 31]|uniref:Uncharacterized protein n=4 Tax=Biquartavirus TaxID=1912143 RepID=Q6U9S9_9CAUD|nr:hypothetical protein ST44RRORF023c [Aeromonas phage 44RR2.8t]YP_238751.1 hypothetical protein PHG31p22 [Aeromonas phage 31]APU00495.1 hypothetical protein [Aeromonas phage 44RR2.8t.2]APU02324.1 hypothetical protein [Aeromonas phage SW69-9]UYD59585.1 hypothetical protein JNMOADIG_00056 [Aeromonas phage avDM5]UYD60441.1 hypothetical protein NPHMPGLK_00106 [Aeromonas phage avDM2]AAQ81342.1 hypothetical protein 44RRORF023c [Aeromonas phage 44RR2.8t]